MAMCFAIAGGHEGTKKRCFVDVGCHPQTIAVCQTRAKSMGITVTVGDHREKPDGSGDLCGILVQYPATDGRLDNFEERCERAHKAGILVVAATDLLALTLIKPPGEWGADIAIGNSQRFGVPMGAGGPHAAFIATKTEYARRMPGRIIGVSRDMQGNPALRMAIQTREQHIKRERATSNICTAQALLAICAGMYAVYHGPLGLRKIALRVRALTAALMNTLQHMGVKDGTGVGGTYFDTIVVRPTRSAEAVVGEGHKLGVNLRLVEGMVGVSLDETTTLDDLRLICQAFGSVPDGLLEQRLGHVLKTDHDYSDNYRRTSTYLTHPVFNTHHSETEMLRYMAKLQKRDLSLADAMIPLGSCTMKLNATSEMIPVTWPEFGRIHPFAPADQTKGDAKVYSDLEKW